MTGTRFETYGGTFIDFANPRAEDVHLTDVAKSLSQVCRFGGHSTTFYSVAEHALLCAHLCEGFGKPVQLAALHHDSHEAYMGDIPTPLKVAFGPVVPMIAFALDVVICERFEVDREEFYLHAVKWADETALAIEVSRLKRCGVGGDWPWGDELPEVEVPRSWVPGRPQADVAFDFEELHRALGGRL